MSKRKTHAAGAPPVVERDDESSDIVPALSSHEWAAWRGQRVNPVTMMREVSAHRPIADTLWKSIAITNDQLHDEDPRKFTRQEVAMLRAAATAAEIAEREQSDPAKSDAYGELYSKLHEFADVIESLLPMET